MKSHHYLMIAGAAAAGYIFANYVWTGSLFSGLYPTSGAFTKNAQ
jgi:hypothetical protein